MDAKQKKNPLPLPGIKSRSRCDQSHCAVTVWTEVSQPFVMGLRKSGYANQVRIRAPQENEGNNVLTAKYRTSTASCDRLSRFVVRFAVSRLNSKVVYTIARTAVYFYTVFIIHLQFHSPLYNLSYLNLL